jgi:hypothetical protein
MRPLRSVLPVEYGIIAGQMPDLLLTPGKPVERYAALAAV